MRNTVRPSVRWSALVSSSNAAAPIGSSPAVGSSRNSSSGSSASARASPARFRMPPESSAGYLGPASAARPGHHDLVRRDLVEQRQRQFGVELAQRDLDVLGDGQRREQRPALEQHAPALADVHPVGLLDPDGRLAEHGDLARVGHLKPDDRPHQHRLAGTRTADHAQDLARPHVEVQPVVDDLIAEAVAQAADPDDVVRHPQFHPIQVKNTAKKASSTITRKMPCTTADVVRAPTCSASPSTCIPWKQPATAMIAPNTGALTSPT